MNRDNIVFATFGFLLGLIIGSLVIGPRFASKLPGSKNVPQSPAPQQAMAPSTAPAAMDSSMEEIHKNIERYQAMLKADPKNTEAMAGLGNIFMDAGMFDQAIERYTQAVAVKPDANILTDLGICLRETGRAEEALARLREARAIDPSHWQAIYNEGVVLVSLGKTGEAKRVVAELKKLRPGSAELASLEKAIAGK